eukprot:TRINITY_DN14365_c0_g1_i1.p1 TRINITY_DN14365_c0_g1~~TRINITY_DN14365_c0_g1_i1.p1  ORF type:complete len:221 (+),score=29.16 TRINITY_DN14365_c0_g1_i1:59-664(+)
MVNTLDKELQLERSEIAQLLEERHKTLLSRISAHFETVSRQTPCIPQQFESVPAERSNQIPELSTDLSRAQAILDKSTGTRDTRDPQGQPAGSNNTSEEEEEEETKSPTMNAAKGEIVRDPSRRSIRSQAVSESSLPKSGCFQRLATSVVFEAVFASLIVVNALVIAWEVQYEGLKLGAELGLEAEFEPSWKSLRLGLPCG